MNARESRAEMEYEDRCEAIRYRLEGRSLRACCTHGAGSRLFADSIANWEQPDRALSPEERVRVIKDMIEWMSRPGLFRRVLGLARDSIILVVDQGDALRHILEMIPGELASAGIPVLIEHDSLQQRRDRFDAMILSSLRTGKSTIEIHGRKVSTPEEFLAIADRHEGFVK